MIQKKKGDTACVMWQNQPDACSKKTRNEALFVKGVTGILVGEQA